LPQDVDRKSETRTKLRPMDEQAHDLRFMLAKGQAIQCPRCGAVSVHPKDIEEGYCGRCHDWTTRCASVVGTTVANP